MANLLRNLAQRIYPVDAVYTPILEIANDTNEQQRIVHFSRLYDYYLGDEADIKKHLEKTMLRTFSLETLDNMQIAYYNIVRRIIDRLALAYKQPADRYIVVSHDSEGNPNEKEQRDQDNYQECLTTSNINAQSKTWHKLAKLGDVVLVAPAWRDDHIEYDVYFPNQISVLERPDNYLEPLAVMYEMSIREGKDYELRKVYWDAENYVVLNKDNKVVPVADNPDNKNPYGLLQFIPLRLRETEGFWGEGDTQLIDICEKVNVLLCSAMHNAIMQSHGQAVAINFNIKGRMPLGPDKLIQVDKVSTDDVTPSFEFKQPQPALQENMQMIDWMVKTAAMMRGLSANSLSLEAKAESGAAKAIDNFELMEIREDDIEVLRPFEKRLFDATRAVWNYHCEPSLRISESAIFGIDFVEPQIQLTPKEEYEIKKMKLGLGLWTPDDDEIDEDEGIDRETARNVVRERLEFRNELNDEFGIMNNLKLLGEQNGTSGTTPDDESLNP